MMGTHSEQKGYELILIIVDAGFGSKILSLSRECGVMGGTIFYGWAVLRNRLMRFFGLADVRKEVVLMIAASSVAEIAFRRIDQELGLNWARHGGVFVSKIGCFYGARVKECVLSAESGGLKKTMYDALYVIVDKGIGESVLETASRAGAKGGIIINARGAGVHETSTLFAMEIEPEKEVVMLLVRQNITQNVITSLNNELKIEEPGNGIIFTQEVKKVFGKF